VTERTSMLYGSLDLLVLRALSLEDLHGLGVATRIEQLTNGTFTVTPGSLFPALHRLERDGWLVARWGKSENNRKAKFYSLTAPGRRHLERETEEWRRVATAMTAALQGI
jgi:PadR family transcriptional regulator PadR